MSSHANGLSRIVSELETNFIVNAGAGTGKTYALVSRVMALVQAGVAMKNIVVITFTRAAAGELSERIRARMEQLLDTHHPDNEGDLLFCRMQSAERERIKTALGQLDQAAIQTIHSFAAQLLHTRPLDIGLPPGWVRNEIEANQRFRDRWNEWLKEALSNKAPAKLQAALRYLLEENIGVNKWRNVARRFSDNTDRIGDNAIQTIDLHATTKDVLLQLQELANQCINPAGSDKLYGQLNGAIGTVKAVLQVADSPAVAAEVLRDSEEVDYSGAFGSAVHCVLQAVVARMQMNGELPLQPNYGVNEWLENLSDTIDSLTQEQAANKGVPTEQQNIGRTVRRALQHNAVRAALQAGRQWSEIAVAAPYDGVVVSGIIDLLYQDTDGQLVILDYKTDSVSSPAEVDDRLQHYQYQGAAYAYAIEKTTQMTVKSVIFLFLNSTKDSLHQVHFRPLITTLRDRIARSTNVAE